MEELTVCLDKFQDEIFAGSFKQADAEFMNAVGLLAGAAESFAPKRLPDFNKLMLEIMQARQNNDYLLLADLFEYKLKPFLKKQ